MKRIINVLLKCGIIKSERHLALIILCTRVCILVMNLTNYNVKKRKNKNRAQVIPTLGKVTSKFIYVLRCDMVSCWQNYLLCGAIGFTSAIVCMQVPDMIAIAQLLKEKGEINWTYDPSII